MKMDEILNAGELTLLVIGVITAMIAGIRRVYKAARWIEDVHTQVHTNGGSTLRDAIVRIEKNVQSISDNQKKIADRVESLENARHATAA